MTSPEFWSGERDTDMEGHVKSTPSSELNRSNEFEMSLLGLLRGYAPAAQHGH